MSKVDHHEVTQSGYRIGSKTFYAWTVFSALAVWFSLSVMEGLAKERCNIDGLAWKWTTWSCTQPGGILIIPPGLRRAGSD
jgi:hypothetical protein